MRTIKHKMKQRTTAIILLVLFPLLLIQLYVGSSYYGFLSNFDKNTATNAADTWEEQGKAPLIMSETADDISSTPPSFVFIVAYMRTGSTFTSNTFQQHPGSFFVFEPLRNIKDASEKDAKIIYLNGAKKWLSQFFYSDTFIAETVKNWMQCKFEHLDIGSLLDSHHYKRSQTMRKFSLCLQDRLEYYNTITNCFSASELEETPSNLHMIMKSSLCKEFESSVVKAMIQCFPTIQRTCDNASARIIKFIRLPMRIAKDLLLDYPNLKIVHLVRDPRGMYVSQIEQSLVDADVNEDALAFSKYVDQCCQRIYDDLQITRTLMKNFPDNIKLLRYEDLASDPIRQSEGLYKFAGLSFTRNVEDYVRNMTSLGKWDNGGYETRRANSSYTAHKWREDVSERLVKIIDRRCGDVYRELGYTKVEWVEQLRNLKLPLYDKNWIF